MVLFFAIVAIASTAYYFLRNRVPPPAPTPKPPSSNITGNDLVTYDGVSYTRIQAGEDIRFKADYSIKFDLNLEKGTGTLFGVNVPNVPNPDTSIDPFLLLSVENSVLHFYDLPSVHLSSDWRFIFNHRWTNIEIVSKTVQKGRQISMIIDGQTIARSPVVEPLIIPAADIVVGGRPNRIYRDDLQNLHGCIRNVSFNGLDPKDITFEGRGSARVTQTCER